MSVEVTINVLIFYHLTLGWLSATLATRSRSQMLSIASLSVASNMFALCYLTLGGGDVAFNEAAIGAGASTALFLASIFRNGEVASSGAIPDTVRNWVYQFALGGLQIILMVANNALPAFGTKVTPAATGLSARIMQHGFALTHTNNFVASIIVAFRSVDTLLETMVVVIGKPILLFICGDIRKLDDTASDEISDEFHLADNLIAKVLASLGIVGSYINAYYLLTHSHYSIGGGFPAGTNIAGATILAHVVFGKELRKVYMTLRFCYIMAFVGIGIYAGIGYIAMRYGGAFLEFGKIEFLGATPDMRNFWGELIAEIGVTLGVSCTITVAFHSVSTRVVSWLRDRKDRPALDTQDLETVDANENEAWTLIKENWYMAITVTGFIVDPDHWQFHYASAFMFLGLRAMALHGNGMKRLYGGSIVTMSIITTALMIAYCYGAGVPVEPTPESGFTLGKFVVAVMAALMLTAIVVGAMISATGLGQLNLTWEHFGTIEEVVLLRLFKKTPNPERPHYDTPPDWFAHATATAIVGYMWYRSMETLLYVVKNGTFSYWVAGWGPPINLGIHWLFSPIRTFVLCLVTGVGFLILLGCREVAAARLGPRQRMFYILAVPLIMGLSGLSLSADMFNVYVFMEITNLTVCGLAAVGNVRAAFFAFRYLMLGNVGASILLLGVIYTFGFTGELEFGLTHKAIMTLPSGHIGIAAARALVFAGLGLKLAMITKQMWLANTYTYMSPPATKLIAPLVTKLNAFALMMMLLGVFGREQVAQSGLGHLLVGLGIVGFVYGSLKSLVQTIVKRLLSFSSISHLNLLVLIMGFMILAKDDQTAAALMAVFAYHMLAHALMKGTLFQGASFIELMIGHTDLTKPEAKSLAQRAPLIFACFIVAILSMVGLPGFAGFITKYVFPTAALVSGLHPDLIDIVTALVVLSSVPSFGYYGVRFVFPLFADQKSGAPKNGFRHAPMLTVSMIIMATLILTFGLWLSTPLLRTLGWNLS